MMGPNFHCRDVKKIGVLVVEQEPLIHPLLRLALEPQGFELKLSTNLRTGLDLLEEHKESLQIALVAGSILGEDPEPALAAFRAIRPTLAIVVMTGDIVTHEPGQLLKLGVARVIRKPFMVSQLVQAVKQAAAGLNAGANTGDGCQSSPEKSG